MNRGNNRRGRAGPTQPRTTLRQSMGLLKSSLHGHANKLGATNPPPFARVPYNTVTLGGEFIPSTGQTGSLVKDLTISNVIDELGDQLGITASGGIRVKIQRVDCWSLPNTTILTGGTANIGVNPEVAAKFFTIVELTGETSGTGAVSAPASLKELEDAGLNGQTAAVVSYTWPRNQQDIPCPKPSTGTSQTLVQFTAPAGCIVLYRVHLHWSTIGNSQLATRFARVSL